VASSPTEAALTEASLRAALVRASGNVTAAAGLLGVSRPTLYNFCTRRKLDLAALRREASGREGDRAG
jgi:transcriptional regulator of acetoin/glycerol metabolism